QPKNALGEADLAVKADPHSAAAHFMLGSIRAALGQTTEAQASFGEVLTLNPKAAVAQTALSALSLATGNPESAVQLPRDAATNAPNILQPKLLLVRGLLARGDLDRATSELSGLTARNPDNATVRALHGLLLLNKKDPTGARREFEFALGRDPRNVDALKG